MRLRTPRHHSLAFACSLVAVLHARPARAQLAVAPHVARNNALAGEPTLYGAAVAVGGPAALRVGGAVDALSTLGGDSAARARSSGAWTADADLVLAPTRLAAVGSLLGGLVPAGFVGVGWQGTRDAQGLSRRVPVWSYGGELSQPLIAGLSLETGARYRMPITARGETTPAEFRRGWEYRLGIALRFGGAPARSRSASTWTVPHAPSTRAPDSRAPAPPVSASRLLATADRYVGTPYAYGGTTPKGFDCSGFVQYVFRRHDVALPRTSREQAHAGRSLATATRALRPGDLVLFAGSGARIDHVAIYAGRNRIIHSSSSGKGVRYDDLSTSRGRWFVEHMVAARRVIADGRSLVPLLDDLDALAKTAPALDPPDLAPAP